MSKLRTAVANTAAFFAIQALVSVAFAGVLALADPAAAQASSSASCERVLVGGRPLTETVNPSCHPPGGSHEDTAEPAPTTVTELTIAYRASGGPPVETSTLWCDPPGGSHDDPLAACEHLDSLEGNPFKPVPPDTICAQIWDGPETARVTGWWRSTWVDATFNRIDSCEITRWNDLVPVLPSHL